MDGIDFLAGILLTAIGAILANRIESFAARVMERWAERKDSNHPE